MQNHVWVTACVTPFHKWRMPIDPNLLQTEASRRNTTQMVLESAAANLVNFPFPLDFLQHYVLLVPQFVVGRDERMGPFVLSPRHTLLHMDLFRSRPRGFGGTTEPQLVGWMWPAKALGE